MATSTQTDSISELVDGDRMTADEFERRYWASPHIRKAELIGGVVYVASPVTLDHCKPHGLVPQWLGFYQLRTPFLSCGVEGTVRLGNLNQPQPDIHLRIDEAHGGRSRISLDRYVEGAPELLIEIAVSSKAFDLKEKLEAYQRSGAPEYIVWRVLDQAIDWFILRDGKYDRLPLGPDGIYRSEVFPGLWLDTGAMIDGDLPAIYRAVQLGLATPEHAAFVAKLRAAAAPK
jgi:Uma2 family endonuclease